MKSRRYLYEELVLLGLHNDKGLLRSMWVPHAISVGVLVELTFLRRIAIDETPGMFVDVLDSTPVDGVLMHRVLQRMTQANGRKRLTEWLLELSRAEDLLPLAAEQLVADGVLEMEESRALLFLKRITFPELDAQPERQIVERLRRVIFEDAVADERTALLIGLAHSANLLRLEYGSDEVNDRLERIDAIVSSSDVSVETVRALGVLSESLRGRVRRG